MTDDRAYRHELAAKLDVLLDRIQAAQEAGEITFLEAADRTLDAIRQQAQLLDLYAPEKVEVVFVDEFSNPIPRPPKGTPPDPALIAAIREQVLQRRAEDKGLGDR